MCNIESTLVKEKGHMKLTLVLSRVQCSRESENDILTHTKRTDRRCWRHIAGDVHGSRGVRMWCGWLSGTVEQTEMARCLQKKKKKNCLTKYVGAVLFSDGVLQC